MSDWTPIGQTQSALVLYHPPSHAVTIRPRAGQAITVPLSRGLPPITVEPAEDEEEEGYGTQDGLIRASGSTDSGVVLARQSSHSAQRHRHPHPLPEDIQEVSSDEDICPYCYRPFTPTSSSSSLPLNNNGNSHHSNGLGRNGSTTTRNRRRRSRSTHHPRNQSSNLPLHQSAQVHSLPDNYTYPISGIIPPDSESNSTLAPVAVDDDLNLGQPSPELYRTRPYFSLLERAHEVQSRPSTPPPLESTSTSTSTRNRAINGTARVEQLPSRRGSSESLSSSTTTTIPRVEDYSISDEEDVEPTEYHTEERSGNGSGIHGGGGGGDLRSIDGYYNRFFKEEKRLGMGAEGSVYLCQHIIDNIPLGHYALKKIAIGNSRPYLAKMLREVKILEGLERHQNVVRYHHVWIERCRFSNFGEEVEALHVLMMYANSGNLDDFISSRSSSLAAPTTFHGDGTSTPPTAEELKRRFRQRRLSSLARGKARTGGGGGLEEKITRQEETRAVMLLSREEVGKLFGDVANGLAFLHANSILHLDLKCSNVLLHMREGELIPTAMISDFGTSAEMVTRKKRERTGHTGTMEYMAPETIIPNQSGHFRDSDSLADMWSLGLILHKLLFFRLPYEGTATFDELEREIQGYRGFKATSDLVASCQRRQIPKELLKLLERLVHVDPVKRPSAEKVMMALNQLRLQMPFTAPPPSEDTSNGQLAIARQITPRFYAPPSSQNGIDTGTGTTIEVVSDQNPFPAAVFALLPPEEKVDEGEWWSGDGLSKRLEVWSGRGLRGRYTKSVLAFLKIASLLPPYRPHSPPAWITYPLILLAIVDLAQSRAEVSVGLLIAHVMLLSLAGLVL